MKNLKKVCGETKKLRGYYDSVYLQLNYDKKEDEVFTDFHCDLGHSWHTFYHDENIVECGNIYDPCTMENIKEMVYTALDFEA